MSSGASASLQGTEELLRALRRLGPRVDRAIENVVRGTAQNIRTKAIKSVQRGPKTGKVYEKTDPNRTHRASAPGQAPATDTGRLASSIQANIDGKRAEVVADTEYAAWLEFGTQKMEARPFLVPALESQREAFNRRLQRVLNQAQGGGTS